MKNNRIKFKNFRVISPIDKKTMDGIPSIRVHHGLDFANSNHIIRWTEVFILKVIFLQKIMLELVDFLKKKNKTNTETISISI